MIRDLTVFSSACRVSGFGAQPFSGALGEVATRNKTQLEGAQMQAEVQVRQYGREEQQLQNGQQSLYAYSTDTSVSDIQVDATVPVLLRTFLYNLHADRNLGPHFLRALFLSDMWPQLGYLTSFVGKIILCVFDQLLVMLIYFGSCVSAYCD